MNCDVITADKKTKTLAKYKAKVGDFLQDDNRVLLKWGLAAIDKLNDQVKGSARENSQLQRKLLAMVESGQKDKRSLPSPKVQTHECHAETCPNPAIFCLLRLRLKETSLRANLQQLRSCKLS